MSGARDGAAGTFLADWLDQHVGGTATDEDSQQSAMALAEACRADAERAGIPLPALAEAVVLRDGGGSGSGLAPLIAVTREDEADTPTLMALGGGA